MNLEEFLADLGNPVDPEDLVIPFGKHRDEYAIDVAEKDPGYFDWLLTKAEHYFVHVHRDVLHEAKNLVAKKRCAGFEDTLTDHQRFCVDRLHTRIQAGRRIVRLEGGAGYGKSFATAALAVALIEEGYEVRACAVSYVATQVLKAQLDDYGISTMTVARLLAFEKRMDQATGRDEYVFSDSTHEMAAKALAPRNALIVDECSMINDEVADLLFETARHNCGVLILVGDSKQLPPVKQEHLSKCCTAVPLDDVAELTVPMRYPVSSSLFLMERQMRNYPREFLSTLRATHFEEGIKVCNSARALFILYLIGYNAEPDASHRMFLFRRKDVVEANNFIRGQLYGTDAGTVEPGEKLMILATADILNRREAGRDHTIPSDFDADRSKAANGSHRKLFDRYYSGQTYGVHDVEDDTYTIDIGDETFEIPCKQVRFETAYGSPMPPVRVIFAIDDARTDASKPGGAEFQAALKAAIAYGRATDPITGKRTGSWIPRRILAADFLYVAYCYAITVHRTQGQTCDYAYCMPKDLLQVPGLMGTSLAYVATTRARKQLAIVL